jgi:hypothetical protein
MGVLKKILIFLLFSNFLLAFNLQKVELRGENIGSFERHIFIQELKQAFYEEGLRGRYKVFAKVRGYSKNFHANKHKFKIHTDYKVYYFDKLVVNANWSLTNSISICGVNKSYAKRQIVKKLFHNIANKIAKSTKEHIKNITRDNRFGIETLCLNRGFDFDNATQLYSKSESDIYYTNFMNWEDRFMLDFNAIKYKKLHNALWYDIDKSTLNHYKLTSINLLDDELHIGDIFIFKTKRFRKGKFKIIGFKHNKSCIQFMWRVFR